MASCISSQVFESMPATCAESGCVLAQARQSNPRWNPAQACQRLPQPWSECIASHSRCLAEMQAGDSVEAYAAILDAVQPFLKVYDPRAALPARRRTHSVSELPTACKPPTCSKTFRQTSGRKVVGWWRIGSCRPLVPCCALCCRGRFGMLRAASSQQPVGFDDRCCRMTCVAAGSCTGVSGGSDCVDGGRHERLRPLPARRGHCCGRATYTAGGHHFCASNACHHQCPHAPACARLPEGGLLAGPEPRLHIARRRGNRKRSWRTAWIGCGSCSSRRSRLRVSLPCWRAPPHWDVRPLLPTEHPCWQPQKATGGEASCAAGAQATKQRGWRHWTWSTCSSRCGTTAASMHRRHAEHSPCTLFTRVTPFQQTTCARTQRIVLRCPSMRPVAPVLLTSG